MTNQWIEKNLKEINKICQSVSKTKDFNDLCQICIEQLLKNKTFPELKEKDKLYFFTKIVKNNFLSKSSPYYYTYYKFQFEPIDTTYEIIDEEYKESEIDITWVKNELRKMDWYYKKLFELFIEENCSITKLSERTTIPFQSISRDINKVRRELIKRRTKFLNQ